MARPLPDRVQTKAVGVTFNPDYPANLHYLAELQRQGPATNAPLEASLVREPENPYDPNAIKVFTNGRFIGHLPRAIAARMAPEIDAGTAWTAVVGEIVFLPDKPEQPGAWIVCTRIRALAEGTP